MSSAVLAITLAAASAFAQTEAPGCGNNKARALSFLEGKWTVESRYRTSSNPEKWEETSAESSILPVFPDCLWREELTGTRSESPLNMIGLFGYSNVSDRFQHTWAHSRHGMLTFYEGDFSNGELLFETRLAVRGKEVRFRKVISKVATGFDVRTLCSTGADSGWQETWVLKYRRLSEKRVSQKSSQQGDRKIN